MKKKFSKKLMLKKEVIASLNPQEMNEINGGGRPSQVGISCFTGRCCHSKKIC
jgi:hypothetical protein